MSEPLETADWDSLLAELREFAGEGNVSVSEGVAHAKTGDGHVELSREGWIRTGMPLHGFEADGNAELTFDHERGHLHVRAGGVEYTFRRP